MPPVFDTFLIGVGLALLSALASLLSQFNIRRWPDLVNRLSFTLLGISGLFAAYSGITQLVTQETTELVIPFGLPWLHWHIKLDALSGFFLFIIGLVLIPVATYGPSYCKEFRHSGEQLPVLGFFTGLFVAGMMMVVLANDAYTFMIAWEVMSLSSYFLVTFQHRNPANRRAGFIYLLMAHIGGLSILLGYGVLAGFADSFTFDAMQHVSLSPFWASTAFAFAFIGFGMKAGIVPLHVWLPEAHPVAPSHISALMSGVMLKVAVYGMVRFTLGLIGVDQIQWQWGVVVLIIGSGTALYGVLYALMQRDIKRILAYSSVENIGIIMLGFGLSLVFYGTGHHQLGIMGFLAMLYHSLNHAVFKSLLFLGAGSVIHGTHERDIEHMGGLLKRMPWTGLFFLIGVISIASLPPFNGFVSEWLIFQTALHNWTIEQGILRFMIPSTAAVLAMTGALAVGAFVRLYGISFLGLPRTQHVRNAHEASGGMLFALAYLAVFCFALGILVAPVLALLNHIPDQLIGAGLGSLNERSWLWLIPIRETDSAIVPASYSPPLVLLGIGLVWLLGSIILHVRKNRKVRRAEVWDCGFSTPNARMQYTGMAFSMPLRRVFKGFFTIEEKVERHEDTSRHFLTVEDRSWKMFYQPIGRSVLFIARHVTLIQSGNIRTYLAWSLATIVLLLWLVSL